AQHLADELCVLLIFEGIVARRLEIEDAAMVLQDIREGCRKFHIADRGAGGGQPRGAALDQRLGRRLGMLPARGPADADSRRRGLAIDRMRRTGDERRVQQRQIIEAAADYAERVEVVALQFDAAAAEFAKARLVAD